MQSVAPTQASTHHVRHVAIKKQPLFNFVRCVLINRHGRILATGHMKPEDFARRNDMLSANGLSCRWRELPKRAPQDLA